MTTLETRAPASPSILHGNLAALMITSPRAAQQIASASPREDLEFIETEQGLSARLDGRQLASRRRPVDEAERLASSVDVHDAGAIVVLGFGLGHHLDALSKRVKNTALFIVFEPDLGLLRAVFERIDCRDWLMTTPTVIVTEPDDAGALGDATERRVAMLAMGVNIVQHPASEARLGDSARTFTEQLTRVVSAMRTSVITTMVQMDVTLRNILMNVDHYTTGGMINDLRDLGQGFAGIVVSAGPSLRRNIELLKDPAIRDRCVIVAVQTVLKPLLREGIRPHFVTALDFHEISRRFYEGLTASDVEGITLIAEPKANPAITESFPGSIRMTADTNLNHLLGDLARGHDALDSGATVAHLAYGFARFLGCDPVMFVGQDLAFTDGQYYAPGAAIHDVWATEINAFNSVEMMEWERIVRMRSHLHEVDDHLGRPVYTDSQMATYLASFERDFMKDAERDLTTIDATEGGAAKAHTVAMTLDDALDQYVRDRSDTLPVIEQVTPAPPMGEARRTEDVRKVEAQIRSVMHDVRSIGRQSRKAGELLKRLSDVIEDDTAANRLIRKVHTIRDEVSERKPAYGLVHTLNQLGSFKRARADRRLRIDEDELTPHERQRRQVERDEVNVQWLGDASDIMADLLDATVESLNGTPKRTRDSAPDVSIEDDSKDAAPPGVVVAVIPFDPARTTLGTPRTDSGTNLRMTLERLRQCTAIERIIITTPDPDAVELLIDATHWRRRIDVCRVAPPDQATHRALRATRLFAPDCWRGGVGYVTAYDEIFDAPSIRQAIGNDDGISGVMLIGPDWIHLDPSICDEIVERYLEQPEINAISFTQAPPGIAGCVIERALIDDFASSQQGGSRSALIGTLLGYQPLRPAPDPVAKPSCVQIDSVVRDGAVRVIPDHSWSRALLERVDPAAHASSVTLMESINGVLAGDEPIAPRHMVLELTTRRAIPGQRIAEIQGRPHLDRPDMPPASARNIIDAFRTMSPDGVISLAGTGDPLMHNDWKDIIAHATMQGIEVHVRTDLVVDQAVVAELMTAGAGIISIDVLANTSACYEQLTGLDEHAYRRLLENLDFLIKQQTARGGLPWPWLVPRMTRCDDVYEEIEAFFDKWRIIVGSAVIDPMPRPVGGGRIEPIRRPFAAMRREARERIMVLSDGTVINDERDLVSGHPIGNVSDRPLIELARDLWHARTAQLRRGESIWTGW